MLSPLILSDRGGGGGERRREGEREISTVGTLQGIFSFHDLPEMRKGRKGRKRGEGKRERGQEGRSRERGEGRKRILHSFSFLLLSLFFPLLLTQLDSVCFLRELVSFFWFFFFFFAAFTTLRVISSQRHACKYGVIFRGGPSFLPPSLSVLDRSRESGAFSWLAH